MLPKPGRLLHGWHSLLHWGLWATASQAPEGTPGPGSQFQPGSSSLGLLACGPPAPLSTVRRPPHSHHAFWCLVDKIFKKDSSIGRFRLRETESSLMGGLWCRVALSRTPLTTGQGFVFPQRSFVPTKLRQVLWWREERGPLSGRPPVTGAKRLCRELRTQAEPGSHPER